MTSEKSGKGHNGERIVWIFLLAVLLVSTAFFFIKAYRLQMQVYDTSKQLLNLDDKLSDQQKAIEDLHQLIQTDSGKSVQLQPVLTDSELTELGSKGIKDPYRGIPADLMKHPELIPFKGEGGRSFGFNSPDKICLLGPSRVWAYVDDSQTGRVLLLGYEVTEGGSITWRVLNQSAQAKP